MLSPSTEELARMSRLPTGSIDHEPIPSLLGFSRKKLEPTTITDEGPLPIPIGH